MEYEVSSHGEMLADTVRMEAYRRALDLAIVPGTLVLDIGTGAGVMALLAIGLGAGRVVAVEHDEVIEVARQIADRNGVSDRIEFVQGRSSDLELDHKADVIVSDLRGVLPLHSGHVQTVIDARRRLLAPGGVLIPRRDTIWAALAEAPSQYEKLIGCWSSNTLGYDMADARELGVNMWWRQRVEESQVLTDKLLIADLDYSTVEDTDFRAAGVVPVRRAGTAYGLCLWFDAELTEGQGFSTAPDQPETIYGNAFFPLSQPVEIEEGDAIHLSLRAIPGGDHYVWAWNTRVERKGSIVADYRQSTALGMPLSRGVLERSSPRFVPSLDTNGAKAKLVLELMAGKLSVQEIAGRVVEAFPNDRDSLGFVVRLVRKFGR